MKDKTILVPYMYSRRLLITIGSWLRGGGNSTSGSGVGSLGGVGSGVGTGGKGGTSIMGSGEVNKGVGATGSGNFRMTGMTKGLDFCEVKGKERNHELSIIQQ